MKIDDLIKYVLIAAGVYVVWQYILVPMMTPTTTTTSAANAVANPTMTQQIPSTAFPSVSGAMVPSIATATPAVPIASPIYGGGGVGPNGQLQM